MKLRGFGDILGFKQSGIKNFKLADPVHNHDLFILAEEKGWIIASAMGGYDGHRGYIYYLAVLPEFRKKGVGSEILKKIETKLLNKGCPKINLFVRDTNLRVRAFYKKNKYQIQESQIYGKRLIED